MQNPYMIDTRGARRPIQEAGMFLRGIAEREEARRLQEEAAAAEQQRGDIRARQFMDAYHAKDPDAVAAFVARNPDMQKLLTDAMAHRNEATKNSQRITMRKILSNPEKAEETLERHISFVEAQGGNADNSKDMLQRFKDDPVGALRDTELGYASVADPKAWEEYKSGKTPDYKGRELDIKEKSLALKGKELSLKERMLVADLKKDTEEDSKERFEQEGKLRNEVNKITQGYREINDAYGRVMASAESPDAPGDMALIFNYMKMLDPGSAVREGEYATAANAGSVGERVIGLYNKVRTGETLTADQRKAFVGRAEKLYDKATDNYKSRTGLYTELAGRMGLAPENVILDQELYRSVMQPAAQAEPPAQQMPATQPTPTVVNWSDL